MSKVKLCLEDLSNEILMEVFDYLYGQQIFISFFNLNHRFNLLCDYYPNFHIDLTDQLLSIKILNRLQHSIPSKHIRSLKFSDEKWLSRISIKYFSSLNSLTFINAANPIKIKECLEKLPLPNQLHHLSVHTNRYEYDVQELVTTTFKLHSLTRLEFDVHGSKLHSVAINQPLLSLRHLSISCYGLNDLLQLVPFIPNLIKLDFSSQTFSHPSNFIFIQSNSLSKLKFLRITNVHTFHEISYLFQLCPQLKIFQTKCYSRYNSYLMVKAKDWEEVLKPMKFLKKIEINVSELYDGVVINLSEYDTDFWIQRNFKAIEYNNQELSRRFLSIK